ncbi:MAG TPA: LytTR family DNA-binding domain-containing protein [Cyclobacteriaceae bacterium]|jgi:DNA-binding LytR/AlgR family response regulator|nr:LytTR family DNA-binding domain-containing protein [Cyclobacteriaceae bacterium]
MNILIIEDEPQAAQRVEKLIEAIVPNVKIVAVLDSVKRAVQWFTSNPSPDLAIMDIQLADGISFNIFEQCKVKCPVIFTTAYEEYALKAFKVNSIDYILKPVDADELKAAVQKYQSLNAAPEKMLESIGFAVQMLAKKYKERFVIKVGEHLKSFEANDIQFFFSMEKTTFGQTADGRKHILDFTIDQLEGLLDPAKFFRINRKYLVNVKSIQDMISHSNSRLKLILKTCDDQDVIVARERVQEFKDWLDR